ncbi:hypothetical protein LP420_35410 [Massilia sp. B-10]|nr:hypothetical protein LP420_35410 [Massilia sp. B-10]
MQDSSHFQEYGAGQLARLVAEGVEENRLGLRAYIGAVSYPAEAARWRAAAPCASAPTAAGRAAAMSIFPSRAAR